jgi:hypothetical protein
VDGVGLAYEAGFSGWVNDSGYAAGGVVFVGGLSMAGGDEPAGALLPNRQSGRVLGANRTARRSKIGIARGVEGVRLVLPSLSLTNFELLLLLALRQSGS